MTAIPVSFARAIALDASMIARAATAAGKDLVMMGTPTAVVVTTLGHKPTSAAFGELRVARSWSFAP
jgi:hypothetical protein